MIKKIHLIFILFVLSLAFNDAALPQSQSEYALIPRLVWQNPPIWKLTKSITESAWGTQLFINSRSEAQGYIMTPWYELWSAASFHLDNAWNRIVFQECLADWIYAIGDRGSGTAQFLWPTKLDVIAPCNDDWYSYLYYIYVADASNDRIVKLSYYWPLGEQEISWDGVITGGGLSLPQDLDINDGGTHHPHSDDYLWVLNGHEIKRFTMDGVLRKTYGTYGCDPEGEGNFCRPAAVVCGRSPWLQPPYEPFANDDWIYVADQGNSRLVALIKWHGIEDIYWYKTLYSDECKHLADLEVDIFGQVWAADKHNGRIYKYTYDLFPLCYYGSFGTAEHQFYYPLNFCNAGGYLGCGNAYVAESWTDNSGGQYFVIGTDIVDFQVTSSVDYLWHYISYVLIDPSDVTIEVYDDQDQLVKTLFDATEYSGACLHVWDGTDQSGQPVGPGSYRVVVADSSSYANIETGQRVNGVIKEAWLYHSYPYGTPPWSLVAGQTGPNEVTLEWEHYCAESRMPWPSFTVYCDGCLCGWSPPLNWTYTDSVLVSGLSHIYWVKSYKNGYESHPSNADTVSVGSALPPVSPGPAFATNESPSEPADTPKQADSAVVAIAFQMVYPGKSALMEIILDNGFFCVQGFDFLIKMDRWSEPLGINFHTEAISVDSTLIGSEWVHYPARECSIDTTNSLASRFHTITCRGQVADTSSSRCKYLWVKGWAPPDDPIDPYAGGYRRLLRFRVDAGCISDTIIFRSTTFDLAFAGLYDPNHNEIPVRYLSSQVQMAFGVAGDANADSLVELGDVMYLVEYLYRRGPAPCIPESGDANGSCEIELGDIVHLTEYLYRGGPPPLPGCWHGE